MLHENDCDDQLILTDIIFCDIVNHIVYSTESFHDCENKADFIIESKHEKQAQISKHDLFIILFELNYFMRIHMTFYNKFARKKKSTFSRFLLDIFKADANVIFTIHLSFESNCIAVII